MRLRVLGTLFEAEWDNRLRHGPRGHAEYHHGIRALHLDGAALFRLGVQLYSRINTFGNISGGLKL